MATGRKVSGESVQRESPPAVGLEASAPTQIVVHYLRLATTRNQLEKEKLRKENILLEAKASAIESAARSEELYTRAIAAMREYAGSITHDYGEAGL